MCLTFGILEIQYADAFPEMFTGAAHEYYYDDIVGQCFSFVDICNKMKENFETEERRYEMMNEWYNLSLPGNIRKYPRKSTLVCFEELVSELLRVRRGLSAEYQTDKSMRDRLQLVCRDVDACFIATLKPAATFEGLCSDIRLSIAAKSRMATYSTDVLLADSTATNQSYSANKNLINTNRMGSTINNHDPNNHTFYTDRRCHVTDNHPRHKKSESK
ncbi:integrase and RNaseH domain-containing protein [Golovinomyces cichoracearum]|uniref:Integrase and RNaseH domain-containing protein n=1 Tax=Golovinomyces cichoracearum TaxID=62708 RepID=A0A420I829_9PEZI|nr:integrase and RNaseH domain-containing protein [Golovinomyces cichoracearum]